mmetsp:Transcript_11010/g.14379  ORF Transcript_11010/g.14379 Transcript_11010/m.14379 type:complete len:142 (-) Transcript_11010:37-462(-)
METSIESSEIPKYALLSLSATRDRSTLSLLSNETELEEDAIPNKRGRRIARLKHKINFKPNIPVLFEDENKSNEFTIVSIIENESHRQSILFVKRIKKRTQEKDPELRVSQYNNSDTIDPNKLRRLNEMMRDMMIMKRLEL